MEYFLRSGEPVTGKQIHNPDRKPYILTKRVCGRCGGAGGSEAWKFTGYTCYDCGGSGLHKNGPAHSYIFTADQLVKLNAAAAKRDAKKSAKQEEARLIAQREADARMSDFLAACGALLDRAKPYAEGSEFINDIITKGLKNAALSEKQVAALAAAIDRIEATAARKANSAWVGQVGERLKGLKLTVSNCVRIETDDYFNPVYYIVTMRDEAGNTFLYKGGSFGPEKGIEVVVTGTVKAHSEYKGEKQTVIARLAVTK